MTTFGAFFSSTQDKLNAKKKKKRQKKPHQNPIYMHYYALNNLRKRFGLKEYSLKKKKIFE